MLVDMSTYLLAALNMWWPAISFGLVLVVLCLWAAAAEDRHDDVSETNDNDHIGRQGAER